MRTWQEVIDHPLVQSVSDERAMGDGLWVYLIEGYWHPLMQCSTIHEDTVGDVVYMLKGVEPR